MPAEVTPIRSSERILKTLETLGSQVSDLYEGQGNIVREVAEAKDEIVGLRADVRRLERVVTEKVTPAIESMRPKVAHAVTEAERISEVPALIDTGVRRGLEQAELEQLRERARDRKAIVLESWKVALTVVLTAILGVVTAAFTYSRGFDAHRESVRLHGGP